MAELDILAKRKEAETAKNYKYNVLCQICLSNNLRTYGKSQKNKLICCIDIVQNLIYRINIKTSGSRMTAIRRAPF